MAVAVTRHKNFVGGEWVESTSGETMEVLNPSTGEVIAEVPRGTAEDAERAVEAAKKAFAEWGDKTPRDRMEPPPKLAAPVGAHARALWQLGSLSGGKPKSIAVDEIPFASDNL